jgi:hypothetical protein
MNAPVALSEMKSPSQREANLPAVAPGFGSLQSFELAMRQAKLLSSSTLVPEQYRQVVEKKKGSEKVREENTNALPNCVIALNMAQRMSADPLMVMQNLYIVEGRPSWSSVWIIAAINGCKRFSPLRFDLEDLGQKEVEYTVTEWIDKQKTYKKMKQTIANLKCTAWAIEKETGEKITSPAVTIEMAVKEGWYQKNGSKWQTMPEVMLRYRTASLFGKIYAPELLMGLPSSDEVQDVGGFIEAQQEPDGSFAVRVESLKAAATSASDAPATVIDTATGEIIDQDDAALREVEQKPVAKAEQPKQPDGNWQPSAEELAEIQAREMAEAAGEQTTNRPRRERGVMSME